MWTSDDNYNFIYGGDAGYQKLAALQLGVLDDATKSHTGLVLESQDLIRTGKISSQVIELHQALFLA